MIEACEARNDIRSDNVDSRSVDTTPEVQPLAEFALGGYHIRPSQQITQLRSFDLVPVGVYGLDGRKIAIAAVDGARDRWLYCLTSPSAEDDARSAANGQATAGGLTSS